MDKPRRGKWLVALSVTLAFLWASSISVHAEAAKKKIRFGIQTPPEVADPEDLIKLWQEAESWGYDSAWTFDHFIPISGNTKGPCVDGWMLLGALATKTSKIPVDLLSHGRLELGIGAGWFEFEHTAYGIPFYTAKERTRRLKESVQIIRSLWTEKETTFTGKYYTIDHAPFEPKPVQKPYPPILIGGQGQKWTLPIVARYADAWNLGNAGPAKTKELIQTLDHLCEKYKRDCNTIEKSNLTSLVLGDDPEKNAATLQRIATARRLTPEQAKEVLLNGNVEEVKKQIQAYIDAGVTHIIIGQRQPYDREGLQRFAKEVMPAFR